VGTSAELPIVTDPWPLYLIGVAMVGYNLLFYLVQRHTPAGGGNVDRNIFLQVLFDLIALTLLLYYAGLPRNPFLFYFVFHMIIAGMYLRGSAPYVVAALATAMVGGVMLLLYLQWIPSYPLRFPSDPPSRRNGNRIFPRQTSFQSRTGRRPWPGAPRNGRPARPHSVPPCGRRSTGTRFMSLWFLFALMTAAAICWAVIE